MGDFEKIEPYVRALRLAGLEPVVLSLGLSGAHLKKIARTLDGILLTGSPADVDPALYGSARHLACSDTDPSRERMDFALLEHAFADRKPVLAICFGIQSLNVFLSGTLVQDIPAELSAPIEHEWEREAGAPETFHEVCIEPGSRLARIARADRACVNSSHHQSILEPGRQLRITARAADGIIEAVEWTGDSTWVTGVQWHPERMADTDPFAQALFQGLAAAARRAPVEIC